MLFWWHHSLICYMKSYVFQEVAVKILMDQDFHPERIREFLREVSIIFFLDERALKLRNIRLMAYVKY